MASKADFNAEEWSQVLEGPPMAAIAVVAAQRGGTVRESISMGKAYAEARKAHTGNALLDEIVASNPEVDKEKVGSHEELQAKVDQHLGEALAVLEAKAEPDDVDAYKRFIMDLAGRVAEAHKSGGFLGIGGERVSDSEEAALNHLAGVLGVDPPASSPA